MNEKKSLEERIQVFETKRRNLMYKISARRLQVNERGEVVRLKHGEVLNPYER